MRQLLSHGWVLALLVAAFAPTPASATGEEPSGDGPVFLIISLTEDFETPDLSCDCDCDCDYDCYYECYCDCDCETPTGSAILLIKIGTFVAGDDLGQTRFIPEDLSDGFPVPEGGYGDFAQHDYTIIGALDTTGPNTVHMLTPIEGEIPADIQVAYFEASPLFPTQFPDYPETSTVLLAEFVATFLPEGSIYDAQDCLYYLFDASFTDEGATNPELVCESPCEGEGEMFPHEPGAHPLFDYAFGIDGEEGTVEVDMCLLVDIDIKPGSYPNSVNLGKKGVLPVAILTTGDFDAADEVDDSTVNIGGVSAKKCSVEDVDDDGDDDLICHFSVPDLVKYKVLTKDSTELTLHAETLDGGCIQGTDSVRIVPPKGKKK